MPAYISEKDRRSQDPISENGGKIRSGRGIRPIGTTVLDRCSGSKYFNPVAIRILNER
jgi:hypothetical protein